MPARHQIRILVAGLWLFGFVSSPPSSGQARAGDIDRTIAAGAQALGESDLQSAGELFQQVLAIEPDHELALLGMSQVLEQQGAYVEALGLAQRALRGSPDSVAATLAVARQQARLGSADKALQTLERLRSLDPVEIEGYLLSSILLRNLGRRDEAIAMLELALERGLRQPELETELAMLLIAADRPQDAKTVIEEGVAEHGDTGGFQLALGLAIANDGISDRAAAIQHLETALELGVPDPGRVQLELGSLLLEDERPAEAIEHLRRAVERMPESPDVYYKLGVAQRTTGDAAGARESLTRFQELKAGQEALERAELETGTTLNEAQSLAAANRLGEALESVDRLLEVDPNEARAHTLRAKILFSLHRPAEALAAIQQARQIEPTQVEPNYLEGMFLLQLGQPAAAREALQRAIDLDPDLAEAFNLLGGAAAKMNQPEDAALFFQRALDLGFDSPSLRLGYAAALESLGRLEESAEQDAAYRRLVERPQ